MNKWSNTVNQYVINIWVQHILQNYFLIPSHKSIHTYFLQIEDRNNNKRQNRGASVEKSWGIYLQTPHNIKYLTQKLSKRRSTQQLGQYITHVRLIHEDNYKNSINKYTHKVIPTFHFNLYF